MFMLYAPLPLKLHTGVLGLRVHWSECLPAYKLILMIIGTPYNLSGLFRDRYDPFYRIGATGIWSAKN